ncbi:helix-turn-helix domain-containing protein [Myceligenerans cantabricum]
MYVLTVDQRGSTRDGDRVPRVLPLVAQVVRGRNGVVLDFARTVGDEIQGVLDDAALVVDVALALLRDQGWSVGIGVGAVDEPLPVESREASGDAFVRARAAVEGAKARPKGSSVAVDGKGASAGEVEALLRLLGAIRSKRTSAGWEVTDTLASLLAEGKPAAQKDAAAVLGISEQAVSQRVRTALWHEEQAVLPVVVRLLTVLDEDATEGDG